MLVEMSVIRWSGTYPDWLIVWYLSVYHDTSVDLVPLIRLATFLNSLAMLKFENSL